MTWASRKLKTKSKRCLRKKECYGLGRDTFQCNESKIIAWVKKLLQNINIQGTITTSCGFNRSSKTRGCRREMAMRWQTLATWEECASKIPKISPNMINSTAMKVNWYLFWIFFSVFLDLLQQSCSEIIPDIYTKTCKTLMKPISCKVVKLETSFKQNGLFYFPFETFKPI